jgi:hypothetical protein
MGRMLLARVLVVIGALLAVVALLAAYVRYQALDTSTVENTAGELIADDAIRDQVAASLVDELFNNVDVEAALNQRLPEQQKGLAGPIAGAVRMGAEPVADRLLERPRIQELWVRSVTQAHRALINVLEGDTRALETEGGNVVLNLRPLIIQFGDRIAIIGNINDRLPPDAGRITIIKSDQLGTAQDLTQLLKVLGLWLWVVPIALWAIALWLARGRRRAIMRMIGISAVVGGLLVLVVRRVAGSVIVDRLSPAESVKVAASHAWEILTSALRDGGLTLLFLGVVMLVGVWLVGPSRSGTATRRWLAPFLARWEIAFGAAAALLLLLVWWGPVIQTRQWRALIAGAIVLAIGVELLRRETRKEFPNADMADSRAAIGRMFGRD